MSAEIHTEILSRVPVVFLSIFFQKFLLYCTHVRLRMEIPTKNPLGILSVIPLVIPSGSSSGMPSKVSPVTLTVFKGFSLEFLQGFL